MVVRMILIVVLFLTRPGAATEFWVATNGIDANPGARAKPFATFERARDAIRQLKLTRLIIAHRSETIASADRAVILGQGANSIVENTSSTSRPFNSRATEASA